MKSLQTSQNSVGQIIKWYMNVCQRYNKWPIFVFAAQMAEKPFT